MTLLLVVLPVCALGLTLFRVSPTYLFCGSMGAAAVVAGVNLYEVVLCGGVKLVVVFLSFWFTPREPVGNRLTWGCTLTTIARTWCSLCC